MKRKPIVRKTPTETLVIYSMGRRTGKVKLCVSFMDRVETGFKWFTVALTGSILVWMCVSIIGEAGGKALAAELAVNSAIPYRIESMPPVLKRICKAESGGVHTKNGKVLTPKNKDGTFDIGICQINSIHLKNAKALELDLYVEKDNLEFAKFLFFTQGSVPWRNSAYGKNGWINN